MYQIQCTKIKAVTVHFEIYLNYRKVKPNEQKGNSSKTNILKLIFNKATYQCFSRIVDQFKIVPFLTYY